MRCMPDGKIGFDVFTVVAMGQLQDVMVLLEFGADSILHMLEGSLTGAVEELLGFVSELKDICCG